MLPSSNIITVVSTLIGTILSSFAITRDDSCLSMLYYMNSPEDPKVLNSINQSIIFTFVHYYNSNKTSGISSMMACCIGVEVIYTQRNYCLLMHYYLLS